MPVTTTVAINVLQAPLTITANATNKIYGAALPVFTESYSGFVNGDTNTSLTTQVALNTSATGASPVGAYTITASGATSSNYDITHVNGTLTINPADLVITANNTNKVYGAALPVFTASYSGFVNGDNASEPHHAGDAWHHRLAGQPDWRLYHHGQRRGLYELQHQLRQRHAHGWHRRSRDHRQ